MPTGPGWWWRMGRNGPYIEEVDGDQNHAPFLAIDGSDVKDDGSWLAEIPDPAKLAAIRAAVDAEREANRRYYVLSWGWDKAPAKAEQLRARAALDALLAEAGEVDRD